MLSGIILVLGSDYARAQEVSEYVAEKPETPAEGKALGWDPILKMSSNIAFSHNRKVVGNPDGANWNLGFLLNSGLCFLNEGGHSWENALKWQLNYTRTSVIDRLIKSLDALEFTSTYFYHIPSIKWLGPFASLVLNTSVFPGYDVRPEDTVVRRLDIAGKEVSIETIAAEDDIELTKAFAPTVFKQSVGVFADAVNKKPIKVNIRAGASAWEVFGQNGYIVADDAATPELDLRVIQDSAMFGSGLILTASGEIKTNLIYNSKAEFMYPFMHNAETDLSGIDILNIEFDFLLGVKLAEWASLDYTVKAYRLPFISEDWQVHNGLLLSLTANII
ncbi:MAG: hypothetical protein JSU92_11950 [Deltaproteobacteria bacterium]|nr:MAG: hypothetical protein JSU92_11950 [Deltaproteobacteria bacterium]